MCLYSITIVILAHMLISHCYCNVSPCAYIPILQYYSINRDMLDEGAYLLVVDRVWRSFCHQMVQIICYMIVII